MSDEELIVFLETELRYPIEITENGCWLFTGGSKNSFHGSLYYKGQPWQAHRLSYTLTCKPIPDGFNVLHSCDVGMCIRPKHLFLGSQTDNIADMDAKGRSNRPQPGEKNGRALLTQQDVMRIRQLAADGKHAISIWQEFNVSLNTIRKIIRRDLWSHI
jgi:hypothetical protein